MLGWNVWIDFFLSKLSGRLLTKRLWQFRHLLCFCSRENVTRVKWSNWSSRKKNTHELLKNPKTACLFAKNYPFLEGLKQSIGTRNTKIDPNKSRCLGLNNLLPNKHLFDAFGSPPHQKKTHETKTLQHPRWTPKHLSDEIWNHAMETCIGVEARPQNSQLIPAPNSAYVFKYWRRS